MRCQAEEMLCPSDRAPEGIPDPSGLIPGSPSPRGVLISAAIMGRHLCVDGSRESNELCADLTASPSIGRELTIQVLCQSLDRPRRFPQTGHKPLGGSMLRFFSSPTAHRLKRG